MGRECYGVAVDVETARDTIAAEAPPRLRLAELLQELGAHDADTPPPPRTASLTVGALVDKAAESGFGFLIGVLTLIAIPFVGLSTPFGLAIALLGAQLMLGRHPRARRTVDRARPRRRGDRHDAARGVRHHRGCHVRAALALAGLTPAPLSATAGAARRCPSARPDPRAA